MLKLPILSKRVLSSFLIAITILSVAIYTVIAHLQASSGQAHEQTTVGSTPTPLKAASSTVVSISTPVPVACSGCWLPTLHTSFQWQLSGTVDPSYTGDLYDIDGLDNGSDVVQTLHQKGHKVACYINAGAWENWRTDAHRFPQSVLGNVLDGWPNEKWLDIRQLTTLSPIIQTRIDICKSRGYNAVEFDNVDGYSNDTGFSISASDQLTYNRWLANQAHQQGMAVLLKNDPDQVKDLLPYFDGELDEQCYEYQECSRFVPFTNANKPVFEVEYSKNISFSAVCKQASQYTFFTQLKDIDLGPTRQWCTTA